MLKSSSLADLNTRHHIISSAEPRPSSQALPQNNPNYRGRSSIRADFQYGEDAIEKTKKKRVILKSRQKFPSDFFNENSDTLDAQQNPRLNPRAVSSDHTKGKRSHSVGPDSLAPTKTPKFSSGMSILSNFPENGTLNETGNRAQTSASKLFTEEPDGLFLPGQFTGPIPIKMIRSQSLAHCPSQTKNEVSKPPQQAYDFANAFSYETFSRVDSEGQKNVDHEVLPAKLKGTVRPRSVGKRRISSFSGIQNLLGAERLRSETNLSSYRDNDNTSQLSTDISTKILPRDAQRNPSEKGLEISQNELEPFGRARTPEKAIVCLPLIKKDMNKFDMAERQSRYNNFLGVPGPQRDSENIHYERSAYRASSSYCSATKSMNTPQRIQSQGGTPDCVGKRENLKASINYVYNNRQKVGGYPQTIFSAKTMETMARFHNSIIKAINQNIPTQNKNEENSLIKTSNSGQYGGQEPKLNLNRRASQPLNGENLLGQNELLLKEKKDPCEFSFSKNFYKDKGLMALRSLLPRSKKDKAEQSDIGKKLREANPEYLKSKSKVFVDSDIKKKFSIVRVKHIQS